MKGIELPVLMMNDATYQAEELNINLPLKDYDVKSITFYQIHAIMEYLDEYDDDAPYSKVFVGGEIFVIALTYEELKAKLDGKD